MDLIISLLAVYGLQFLITQSNGPFNLISRFRNWLFLRKSCGPFFFDLFSCSFYSCCWAGTIIYPLTGQSWKLAPFILWVLTSGTVGLILEAILSRLHREP